MIETSYYLLHESPALVSGSSCWNHLQRLFLRSFVSRNILFVRCRLSSPNTQLYCCSADQEIVTMGVHADSPGPNCSRSPLSTFEDGGGTNTMRSSDAKPNQIAFAGRLGANQAFILEPGSSVDISTIKRIPDASPFMSWQEQVDLRGFRQIELWRAGLVEGVGESTWCFECFVEAWLTVEYKAPYSLHT